MRVLLLAPHPFFQERGTPIDVLLVLRVLSARDGVEVDVVTYHEGEDIDLPGVTLHRIRPFPRVDNVRPGFSLKKVVCDIALLREARRLARKRVYDLIHAGEEAVFIARHVRRVHGIPYAYDLDSSIAQQMVEQKPWLRPVARVLDAFESRAIRESLINFPVCNALADLCEDRGSPRTVTLHDISQLDPGAADEGRLSRETELRGTVLLYSGNLQPYQGVDLMLESFRVARGRGGDLTLVVIGGTEADVARYRAKAEALGIADRTRLLGHRPLEHLADYLAGADVLVCPRIRGVNTPQKIFPYLHSGRAVLATELPTHTQILTGEEALLASPTPEAFGAAMLRLAADDGLRERLGRAGRAFVERDHTYEAHRRRLDEAYDWIEKQLTGRPSKVA
jgi:glycosyltransferase involved in cell wall biosynthesis